MFFVLFWNAKISISCPFFSYSFRQINQFREKHVGLQKSEEEYRSKQDRVNELNKSLNDISEELEDVKVCLFLSIVVLNLEGAIGVR